MASLALKEAVFIHVPLSPQALAELHAIARQNNTTALYVLKGIIEKYQRNGKPPTVPDPTTDDVYRGVPVSHRVLREIGELEAEARYKTSSLSFLRAIVESELHNMAAKLST